jgi:hypothetical protein
MPGKEQRPLIESVGTRLTEVGSALGSAQAMFDRIERTPSDWTDADIVCEALAHLRRQLIEALDVARRLESDLDAELREGPLYEANVALGVVDPVADAKAVEAIEAEAKRKGVAW